MRATVGDDARPGRSQEPEFSAPADEGPRRERTRRWARERRDGPPGSERLSFALHDQRLEGLVFDAPGGSPPRLLTDENGAPRGGGLQARSGVDDVTGDRLLTTVLWTDGGEHHLATLYPNAQRETSEIGWVFGRALLHLERRPEGSLGVVLMGNGGTEDCEQPVAHHLVHGSTEAMNDLAEHIHAPVDNGPDVLGIALLGQRCEAREISEEHRGPASFFR
ncbi:MAG TPA: hypothetical protein VIX84_10730 [Acidimicrobiales bacterium]